MALTLLMIYITQRVFTNIEVSLFMVQLSSKVTFECVWNHSRRTQSGTYIRCICASTKPRNKAVATL